MYINDLSPVAGSTHVNKRKGRGHATGNGKTAGRGHKGQKARSGGGTRIGFEGGQMPLARRIPKRGFNNIFAKPLDGVNVAVLNKFEDGAVVDTQALLDAGVLSNSKYGIKFLGNGDKVKVSIRFRGRQITHPEIGMQVMQDFVKRVQDMATVERKPLIEGRHMIMILAPKDPSKEAKQAPKQ